MDYTWIIHSKTKQHYEKVTGSQCDAACCSALQWTAVCCSVFQCVAACCSVLQCNTRRLWCVVNLQEGLRVWLWPPVPPPLLYVLPVRKQSSWQQVFRFSRRLCEERVWHVQIGVWPSVPPLLRTALILKEFVREYVGFREWLCGECVTHPNLIMGSTVALHWTFVWK